jgi:cell wall-associated NlpC family hydrolase
MERNTARVVARARLALGAHFHPQGRTIEEGLDCVGLAAFAFAADAAGLPRDYPLRGTKPGALAGQLEAHGLSKVHGTELRQGDVAVFAPGPGQLHLAIATGTTLIHADAGLRRVVERPLPAPWPLAGLWRLRPELENM